MQKTVLSIDPGTIKCGMAVVRREDHGHLAMLWRSIVPTQTAANHAQTQLAKQPYEMVIVGGGTHSKQVVESIRAIMPSMSILVVDERETSLQARERYWEYNPRKGWRRMLPATLQVPPEPVDDFVALILAERVLLG